MRTFRTSRALLLSAVVAAAFFHAAQAQLTVSNVLQYQVIQRDSTSSTATFQDSGTCRSGTTRFQILLLNQSDNSVVAGFSWTELSAVTVNGTAWRATMSGLPVGGEYIARFRALNGSGTITDSSASIQHLLVGDIWLCAGQSNMQQAGGSNTDPTHVHVRLLDRRKESFRIAPLLRRNGRIRGSPFPAGHVRAAVPGPEELACQTGRLETIGD